MGPIRVDPSWEAGAYTLSTKELGLQGLTLFPSVGNEFNSSNSNVNIYINSNLSSMGKAETASHELLGHAFISSLGLNPEHNYRLGGEEGNIILKTQIIQSTN
jgi:hypothetical protein